MILSLVFLSYYIHNFILWENIFNTYNTKYLHYNNISYNTNLQQKLIQDKKFLN